jgi:sister-chromatid-cohesion protein PDS5
MLPMFRDVQLLIACCIADILRIFAPEAPYKEPAQIKTIFLFIIRQLGGLKDPKVQNRNNRYY